MDASSLPPSLDAGKFALDQLSGMVDRLRKVAPSEAPLTENPEVQASENRLAMVRLGMATALFNALRVKHPPSASHSLRVAIDCSLWAEACGMEANERDRFEVAALLHDIGKIGIPDRILKKPASLTAEERLTVDIQTALGCEILRGCCNDELLLETVRRFHDRFDDRRAGAQGDGEAIPRTARMLGIVEAFDSMTSHQVYRKALSPEDAFAELRRCAGTQFDPVLVQEYESLISGGRERLRSLTVRRWLKELGQEETQRYWSRISHAGEGPPPVIAAPDPLLLHSEFVRRSTDGVMLLDPEGIVISWNESLQRITGNTEADCLGKPFNAKMLGLVDASGRLLEGDTCPVTFSLRSGRELETDIRISGVHGRPARINVLPITSPAGIRAGLVTMVRLDANLPLSGRTDRPADGSDAVDAEGGGAAHRRLASTERPYTLILLRGDFASAVSPATRSQFSDLAGRALRRVCRTEDTLFAPRAGELAVVASTLLSDQLAFRIEEFKEAISAIDLPVPPLFTAIDAPAGTPVDESIERARQAEPQQLDAGPARHGSGKNAAASSSHSFWMSWLGETADSAAQVEVVDKLITSVPRQLAIQKLEGFVVDHHAVIKKQTEDSVSLQLGASHREGGRRRIDRHILFNLDVRVSEEETAHAHRGNAHKTRRSVLTVVVKPVKPRDRRRRNCRAAAEGLLDTLKSYLMAESIDDA